MKDITSIIESAYILPVLLEHYKNPSPQSQAILDKHDISSKDLYKYHHLLEYHEHFLRTREENYPLLRKGLDEYFDSDLSDIFKLIGIDHKTWYMLDYGAGNGTYAQQFILDNPASQALCVDRHFATKAGRHISYLEVDFEKRPDWYQKYINEFNMVLMSELLHCKDSEGQQHLIWTAKQMLKNDGLLIINENDDLEMYWRIGQLKGRNQKPLTFADLQALTKNKFKFKSKVTINQHNAYVFQKIQSLS